jgi:hypothetical protein
MFFLLLPYGASGNWEIVYASRRLLGRIWNPSCWRLLLWSKVGRSYVHQAMFRSSTPGFWILLRSKQRPMRIMWWYPRTSVVHECNKLEVQYFTAEAKALPSGSSFLEGTWNGIDGCNPSECYNNVLISPKIARLSPVMDVKWNVWSKAKPGKLTTRRGRRQRVAKELSSERYIHHSTNLLWEQVSLLIIVISLIQSGMLMSQTKSAKERLEPGAGTGAKGVDR